MQQIPQTFRNFIALGSLANFWCYKRKQNKTITVRRNFTKYKSCSGPESSKSKQPTFCDDTTGSCFLREMKRRNSMRF